MENLLGWSRAVLLNLSRFRSPLPSIAAFPFTPERMHVPCDNNKLTVANTVLLSLIFVQYLLKLSNSFKDSRIRINCREMGSYKNNLATNIVIR